MKGGKTLKIILIIVIILISITLGVIGAYLFLDTNQNNGGQTLTNPVINLTDEEAVQLFDETFVEYLLYSIEADELNKNPLSQNTPKIEFQADDIIYSAEIRKHVVYVSEGEIENEDIIIRTTKEEAVKMLRDVNYLQESFNSGETSVKLVAGETTLFAKGYLKIYSNLAGEETN